MPYWLITTKNITLLKYLVETDTIEEAISNYDHGYLGYQDVEVSTGDCPCAPCVAMRTEVHGPFATLEEATSTGLTDTDDGEHR